MIAQAGADRDGIRATLAKVGSATLAFEGITGTVAFDADGDVANRSVFIGRVHDGAVELQESH